MDTYQLKQEILDELYYQLLQRVKNMEFVRAREILEMMKEVAMLPDNWDWRGRLASF